MVIRQQHFLTLAWRTRPSGGGKTERTFLDFLVNGQSLADVLEVGDRISCLGWDTLERDAETVLVLRLKEPSPAPLEAGRILLYVCAECGDLGCGAVTALVEKTTDHFVWRDFAFENDDEPTMMDREEYREVGPFFFNKTDYWQALTDAPPQASAEVKREDTERAAQGNQAGR